MWKPNTRMLSARCTKASQLAATVLAVPALLVGFAFAPAWAEPVPMAAQHMEKSTRDGWQLSLSLDHELVNSVPNLANATNSREAFVTLSATAVVTGGASSITDSTVITGYQMGCQSDVSSGLGIGGAGAFGPTTPSAASTRSTGRA
jgi:MspA